MKRNKLSAPIVSVAGVRGIIGESVVPDDYLRRLLAFATMVNGRKIVVGGDTRPSREMLRHIAFGGLIASGYEVLDLGICPTPTVGLMIRKLKAEGGVAITASHNPIEWNAFKFFSARGTFITKRENERLEKIYQQRAFRLASVDKLGIVKQIASPLEPHLAQTLDFVNVRKIRQQRIKVVVDCCNGAGSVIIPELLRRLNCRVIAINTDVNKPFPHKPEPLPENLGQLCEEVKRQRADIGFAIDPDADRLAIIDEKGMPLGEERTLVIGAYHYLSSRGKTSLVVNLSVTRAIEDVANKFVVKVYRTPVGEANVVEKMLRIGAKFGGEGNGGVIIPAVHPGRDATTGIAFILEAMAAKQQSISELNKCVPDYVMLKSAIRRSTTIDVAQLLKNFEAIFAAEAKRIEREDGVKITLKNGNWIIARPSGTEPIIRIFAEAETRAEAEELQRLAFAAFKKQ